MLPHYYHFLLDAGIGAVGLFFGMYIAILAFIGVVFIEAGIMKAIFKFSLKKSLKNSFIINIISTIIGLPLGFWTGIELFGSYIMKAGDVLFLPLLLIEFMFYPGVAVDYYTELLCAFFITILIEYVIFLFLLRPKPPYKKALIFAFLSNLASYAFLAFAPFVIRSIWVLIWAYK
jgi:hypothetical protein